MLFLLLFGCQDKIILKNELQKCISFTLTYEVEGTLTSDVYYFDLLDEEVKKVASLPYTSQYPLTVYDKKKNLIYYTAKHENQQKDDILVNSLNEKCTSKIDTTLFAMNYLIPYEDTLFIAGVPVGERAVHPYLYDKNTSKLQDLTWDNDFHISFVNFCPDDKSFVVAGYSSTELYEHIDNQMNGAFEPVKNYLFSTNDESHGIVFETTEDNIVSVAINQSFYYYSLDYQTLYKISRKDATQSIFIPEDSGLKFDSIIYVTDNEEFVYYINDKEIRKYNTDTKEDVSIFSDQREKSKINNAMILSE